MNAFQCPFCYCTIPKTKDTFYTSSASFYNSSSHPVGFESDYRLSVDFCKCPYCDNISSILHYDGAKLPQKTIPIYPQSFAKQLFITNTQVGTHIFLHL